MREPFNTKISVFKNLFNSKDTPYTLSLTEIYNRIKTGNIPLIEKIEKIRDNNISKEEKSKHKNSLLAIMFNGIFNERNDDGLVEHSGLCVLDFDGYESEEKLQEELERLKADKYTLMAFISPSGNGLKALIRIPKCDKIEHKRRFNAYREYFKSEYFDEKNCNVSRVCFESYDPNVYLNQFCDEFTEIETEKGFSYSEKVPICILEDEQKKIDIINKFNFKRDFREGERNAFIFDLAGQYCEYGISLDSAIGEITTNVIIGDFSESEAITTIKSAYKKRQFDSKYFEDYTKVETIKKKIRKGVDPNTIKKEHNVGDDVINDIQEQLIDNVDEFWEVHITKSGNTIIKIDNLKYASFLVKNGFNKYYPENGEKPTFVRVIENKVKLSSSDQIKDFVLDYLMNAKEFDVWNFVTKNTMLFNESFLNMIDSINLKMLQDDKDTSFIPFKNGVARITKNSIELINYIDVEGYIWENQIINRDFEVVANFENDFQDFIKKISASDPLRTESLETTLGYLVHSYKDKTDQKAIIFNDQEIDDNPNGGSGKSLMLNALANFRKIVKIDGKAFDPKKSDFVYQRVNLDTQILAFDDVRKNFNFENLFSLITEGITVNRKNKDEIFIPFERSPKIIITTNYVINGVGSSHERRRHEIEIYQYFNNRRSPLNEYGRLLFDSWNQEDWLKFDNYMISILQLFLRKGLTSTVSINAEAKRLIQATSKDFYDWAMDENISLDSKLHYHGFRDKFIVDNQGYKDLNIRTLLKWVKEYAIYKGYEMVQDRDHNGRYFIVHSTPTDTITEDDNEVAF